MIELVHADSYAYLETLPENSIDTILTDPPYGINFMGKSWDYDIPKRDFWKRALRVCKPGASALVFGGTRTFHRIAVEMEEAGWFIRDCLMWLYGSGFPKSYDIGKAVGAEWEGWGTALKPAWEPILLAMKPLEGSYAENATTFGVSGLHIEAARLTSGRYPSNLLLDEESAALLDSSTKPSKSLRSQRGEVRIFDKASQGFTNEWIGESTERGYNDAGGVSRFFYIAKASKRERDEGLTEMKEGVRVNAPRESEAEKTKPRLNNHPTVKPIELLEYLCKLTGTPTRGIVLDPFMGSGSTGIAALRASRSFLGVEIDPDYFELARKRIEYFRTKG